MTNAPPRCPKHLTAMMALRVIHAFHQVVMKCCLRSCEHKLTLSFDIYKTTYGGEPPVKGLDQ